MEKSKGAESHPFKGVENYFTDFFLYQDSLETDENPQLEERDSSNEVDVEPEAEEEYLWELNLLVMSINNLNVNNNYQWCKRVVY